MRNHDHLEPLPDPTPANLWGMFCWGTVIGMSVMVADALVMHHLFGFENAWITYAMWFSTIFLVTGAFKDDSVPMNMAAIAGIVIGALGINLMRVLVFDAASMLGAIGL